MEKFGKSQSVIRKEDVRLLTGEGRYVDDIAPANALHAFFFRSNVAHAEITKLDVTEAKAAPGVHAVLTIDDFEAEGTKIGLGFTQAPNKDGSKGAKPLRPILAKGRVRHVGEALACIVADTMEQAKDAAELIEFDYEELNVKIDVAEGGAEIYPAEAPGNVVFDFADGDAEATDKAFAEAAHVVELEVGDNRIIVNSLEPRGAYAEWDDGRLHVCVNGQGVWGTKGTLASSYGLEPEAVRVTNPDVGGGFGMKAMDYPEYLVIPLAAKRAGRPVRWMAERTESMLSDNAGRDLVSTTSLAFDADHKLIGYKVKTLSNIGAYCSGYAQMIQSYLFARVLMGTYDVQAAYLEVKGIFTNTAPVDAYRGAGRPEAIYALERSMENAARVLGVDAWELRKKSFIKPDQFPYKTVTGELYDVGDFVKVLDRAAIESDRAGFEARRAASAANGKLRGIGLCYYIESILGDPGEHAQVDFNEDGTATIYDGTQSTGQGHETVFTPFLSDQTGSPADKTN